MMAMLIIIQSLVPVLEMMLTTSGGLCTCNLISRLKDIS